jgi:hypothetical protein
VTPLSRHPSMFMHDPNARPDSHARIHSANRRCLDSMCFNVYSAKNRGPTGMSLLLLCLFSSPFRSNVQAYNTQHATRNIKFHNQSINQSNNQSPPTLPHTHSSKSKHTLPLLHSTTLHHTTLHSTHTKKTRHHSFQPYLFS